jgi:ATP-dependent DNA helicase RecG
MLARVVRSPARTGRAKNPNRMGLRLHSGILEKDNSVLVNIRHSPLASLEDAVMTYLKSYDEITNTIAHDICDIRSENSMKNVLLSLKKRGLIEPVPERKDRASAWRKVRPVTG